MVGWGWDPLSRGRVADWNPVTAYGTISNILMNTSAETHCAFCASYESPNSSNLFLDPLAHVSSIVTLMSARTPSLQ